MTQEEINISSIIPLFLDNLSQQTFNIDLNSRKVLSKISINFPQEVVDLSLSKLSSLLKTDNQDTVYTIVYILKEILERNASLSYAPVSLFISKNFSQLTSVHSSIKKTFKQNFQTSLKILTFSSLSFFPHVLNDLLSIIPSGVKPKKIALTAAIDIAKEFPLKSAEKFSSVLSRILPMLGTITKDSKKLIILQLFSTVTEAISIAQQEGKTDILSSYVTIYTTAFDLIKSQWLQTISPKNKTLGNGYLLTISSTLPITIVKSNIENIVMLFCNNDHFDKDDNASNFILSKGMRIFCEENVEDISEQFVAYIDKVMNKIMLLCSKENISVNAVKYEEDFIPVKNELFKLVVKLSSQYKDFMINFLVGKITKSPTQIERLTGLILMKTIALMNSELGSYKTLLCETVIVAGKDNKDLETKIALLDLVSVMFDKGLILNNYVLTIIEFIVLESGNVEEFKEDSYPYLTNKEKVVVYSKRTLTDIVKFETFDLLYPMIYEIFIKERNANCLVTICDVINNLFNLKECNKEIDYNKIPITTPAPQIIIKLLIALTGAFELSLSSSPLLALKNIIALFGNSEDDYKNIFTSLEALMKKNNISKEDEENFRSLLLKFFDEMTSRILSEEFFTSFCTGINKFIKQYTMNELVLGILIPMQGIVLGKIKQKEIINAELDSVFSIVHNEYKSGTIDENVTSVQPTQKNVNNICEMFGYTVRGNPDVVLEKIKSILHSQIIQKKVTGFAAFFTSGSTGKIPAHIVSTLIRAYGVVAKNIDANFLRRDNFLSIIDEYYQKKSDSNYDKILDACLEAYCNIFEGLTKLSSSFIEQSTEVLYLNTRDKYMEIFISLILSNKKYTSISFKALGHLITLDPPILLCKCIQLIDMAVDNFSQETSDSISVLFNGLISHSLHSTTMEINFMRKNELFISSYSKEFSSWEMTSYIIERMRNKYFQSAHQGEICVLLQKFVNSKRVMKFESEKEIDYWCSSTVSILGILFDQQSDNETMLLILMRLLTSIEVYEIDFSTTDALIVSLTKNIQSKLNSISYSDFLIRIITLHLIKNVFTSTNISSFITTAILEISLTDEFTKGEYNWLLIKILKSALAVLTTLINEEGCTWSPTIEQVLRTTDALCKVNVEIIINELLESELTVAGAAVIKNSLCSDKATISKAIAQVTDVINNPTNEEPLSVRQCTGTILIGMMLSSKKEILKEIIKECIPELLSTLLFRIAIVHHGIKAANKEFQNKDDDPRNQTIWSLQNLMSYCEEEELNGVLGSDGSIAKKLLKENEYDEGVYELMTIYCKVVPVENIQKLFNFLYDFSDRESGEKVVIASIISQAINFSYNFENDFVRKIISLLSQQLNDKNSDVRKMSVRGFGNFRKAFLTGDKVFYEISYDIITKIIALCNDSEDSVIIESFNTLRNIIPFTNKEILKSILESLLVAIKEKFDWKDFYVRSLTFALCEELVSFCDEKMVNSVLVFYIVPMMVHLIDGAGNVSSPALSCLKKVCQAIVKEEVCGDTIKISEGDYIEKVSEIVKRIVDRINVSELFKQCTVYAISSVNEEVRGNSAFAITVLYNLNPTIGADKVFQVFELIFKDKSLLVQSRATIAFEKLNLSVS